MKATLDRLAALVEGTVSGDPNKIVTAAAPFDAAGGDEITLAGNAKFLKKIGHSAAGAIIVPPGTVAEGCNLILVENPALAFAKVLAYFHPPQKAAPGIHPGAALGKDFVCGHDASIGPHAALGDRVRLGDRVQLYPGVVVGDDVVIGDDVTLYPQVVVLAHCRIGNRVIIHAGTVIGSDGFGFAPDGRLYHKIPHTGIVQIDDDVEIGANNTIDRATFGKTWIQRGVKTDNLVHIAHNVTVGENTVIVAQVGLSGSVTVGKHVILAGQAGVAGHLTVGDDATVGPQAGVGKDVPQGQIVSGAPAIPHRLWLRVVRIIPLLPELKKRLTALEKKIQKSNVTDP